MLKIQLQGVSYLLHIFFSLMNYPELIIDEEILNSSTFSREFETLIIPFNRDENHWILIVVNRIERIIKVFDPFQCDACVDAITLIEKIEQTNGFLDYDYQFKRNFPKQSDSFNCGICIMALAFSNLDLTNYKWDIIEDFWFLFAEKIISILI